jgi:hypothetical protein
MAAAKGLVAGVVNLTIALVADDNFVPRIQCVLLRSLARESTPPQVHSSHQGPV